MPMSDSEMGQVTAGVPTSPEIRIHGVGPNGDGIVTPPAQSEPPEQSFSGKAPNNRCANCSAVSDRRLKRDIEQVARLDKPLSLPLQLE